MLSRQLISMLKLESILNLLIQIIMSNKESKKPDEESKNHPGFLSVLQSVIAAMCGIQSDEKRKKDFEGGNFSSYIFVGIIMCIVFVFGIIALVNSILENHAQGG